MRTTDWILVTTINEGSKVIGQVHEMGLVGTAHGHGRSVVRVLLASPFLCPDTMVQSQFVVPRTQAPLHAGGLAFSMEDVHICELHIYDDGAAYRFTPLK